MIDATGVRIACVILNVPFSSLHPAVAGLRPAGNFQFLRLFHNLLHEVQVRLALDEARKLLRKHPEMGIDLLTIDLYGRSILRYRKHESNALSANMIGAKLPVRCGKIVLVAPFTLADDSSANPRFFGKFPERRLLYGFSVFDPPLGELPGIAFAGFSEQQQLKHTRFSRTGTQEDQRCACTVRVGHGATIAQTRRLERARAFSAYAR